MKKIIRSAVNQNRKVIRTVLSGENLAKIARIATLIVSSVKKGGKVLVFGNGGSAADSQHMVAELVGRYKRERRAIPAVALTTNTSTLTALSNDYSYDTIFRRQIEALGRKGDIAFGISTSGTARNVLMGLKKARAMGLVSIALTGKGGGKLKRVADHSIVIQSDDTPRIQEAHILIIHILCGLIEDRVRTE